MFLDFYCAAAATTTATKEKDIVSLVQKSRY